MRAATAALASVVDGVVELAGAAPASHPALSPLWPHIGAGHFSPQSPLTGARFRDWARNCISQSRSIKMLLG